MMEMIWEYTYMYFHPLILICCCSLIVYCYILIVCYRRRDALKIKIKTKQDQCRQSLEKFTKLPAPVNRVITRRSKKSEIIDLSLEKLLDKLKAGTYGAKDVLTEYLQKALEVNKEFKCVVEAIKEAEDLAMDCDKMRNSKEQHKRPLHGLPVSLKENYFLKDYDSTAGMSDYIGIPCKEDAVIVQVLKKQGAVPFVRTNIPQTMMTYECSNPIYGQTVNPHDGTKGPGGSSGGEACIIAAKGSLLGFGNDIGGSIRIPCHMCGVCGLKPTYGRLSAKGIFELMSGQTLINATTGPMARDVTSLVIAMEALLCDDMFVLDPTVPPIPFRMEIYEKTNELKIGYYIFDGYLKPVPACKRAVMDAKAILERQGHELVHFEVPDVKDIFTEIYLPIIFGDNAKTLWECLKNDNIDPTIWLAVRSWSLPKFVQWLMSWVVSYIYNDNIVGKGMRSTCKSKNVYDWWKLAERLQKYKKKFLSLWRSHKLDVLICPGFAFPAVPNGAVFNVLGGVTYTALYNLLDYPAGTVPITKVTREDEAGMKEYPTNTRYERFIKKYYSEDTVGLPVGVQCVGLPYQEELVLRVMKMLENENIHHHHD
ncbi:hypothetical protein CHS0354_033841 [Potamilus streckersoni]|uniref:fatty acid amide hydrolase n=1 Tax=Potamilus streckersoni TaxID=2493646 RepID=A0AAE0T7U8_9BIVA|nr:hypothetical protein CHS0354_033841 [Potamilus streckersoni]